MIGIPNRLLFFKNNNYYIFTHKDYNVYLTKMVIEFLGYLMSEIMFVTKNVPN